MQYFGLGFIKQEVNEVQKSFGIKERDWPAHVIWFILLIGLITGTVFFANTESIESPQKFVTATSSNPIQNSVLPSSTTATIVRPVVNAKDSNVSIGNLAPVSQTINKYPPPKLTVEQISHSQLREDGYYHTSYSLVWDDPLGILQGDDRRFRSNGIFTECLPPISAGFQLKGSRMAEMSKIECLSKEIPPKPEEMLLFCMITLCPKDAVIVW